MFRRTLVCAVALAGLLSVASLEASAQAGGSVRILAPADGSLLTSRSLRVVVAASSRPRVWLESRQITRLLRRSGGRWVADLPAGAIGAAGPHYVYARLGSGFSAVRFVLGRRSPQLLAVSGPNVLLARGSVAIGLRLGTPGSVLRGWLNGRRLALGPGPFPAGSDRLRLGADDGLRFGPNKLTVLSFQDGGSYDQRSLTVLVSRDHPLVGAGPDQLREVGQVVGLSGRSSRAARRGDRLSFRWAIASAPRGSRARLTGASSSRAALRADLPGRYVLRLTVSEHPARGRGRGLRSAVDFTTIDERPADPPVGVPIETLDEEGQVLVDGRPIAGTGGEDVNLVVLSRATRTVVSARTYRRDATSLAALRDAVGALARAGESGRLVVISARAGDAWSGAERGSLLAALGDIGVTLTGTAGSQLADGEAFSAIGVPAAPPGAGFANVLSQFSTDPAHELPSGDLRGLLQWSERFQKYGFLFSDYVPFDTSAADTARSNTIDVGGQSYTQQFDSDVPAGASGFALLALDRTSLQPLRAFDSNLAIATNAGDPAQDASGQQELAGALDTAAHFNALVVLQSIGHPYPTSTEWNGLARAVGRLGGTIPVFNELDSKGGYALVGGSDLQPAEASVYIDNRPVYPKAPPAQLSGVLGRNHDAAFQALLADPLGNVRQQMFTVAYQEAEPFISFDPSVNPDATAGMKRADAYITQKKLDYPQDSDPRHQYWDDFNANWNGKNANLECANPPEGQGFTAAEYKTVCVQLKQEMTDLGTVKNYIKLLQKPFEDKSTGFIDLQEIGDSIKTSLQPPDANATADTAQLISNVLTGGSKVVAGTQVGTALGALSGVFQLAGIVMTADGSPVLGKVTAKVDGLAHETVTRFEDARDALNTLGEILVSDWGKLQAAASNISGPWKYPASDGRVRDAFRKGVKQWYYEQLLPTAWKVFALNWDPGERVRNAQDWVCNEGADSTLTYRPFDGEPASGQFRPILGFSSDPSRKPPVLADQPKILALGQPLRRKHFAGPFTADPPSGDVIDQLFLTPDDKDNNKLGLFPELLYTHGFELVVPRSGPATRADCKAGADPAPASLTAGLG